LFFNKKNQQKKGLYTIELILYLEPCLVFKQSVEQFLDQCKIKFGSTTANKYGCHVTMTGFFTVTDKQEQTAIQQYIDQTLSEFKLPTLTLSPQVDCKSVLVHDSNGCPVHLLLPVTVPEKYLDAMVTLAERCQHIVKLRLKKINHISLAYWDEPEATKEQQQHWEELKRKNLFEQIQKEAEEYLAATEKPQSWDIVLYKRVTKGSLVDETHLFEELSRWHCT
jgi:hypothetical protein